MAYDAAKCLHELIAAGEEIPYEVREPGDGSPLCRYEPLTELFVRDHAGRAARARLLRRRLRRARGRRSRRPLPRADGDRGPDRAAPAGRARRRRLPLPALDRQHRLHARGRSARRRDRRAAEPAATPTSARSRSSSRCAACRCRSPGSTSPPPRSSAPTPSTCRPRPAPATASGSRPGSPPSSPWSASYEPDDADADSPIPGSPPSRLPAIWSPPCGCSRPAASGSARTPGRGSRGDRWRRIATGAGRQRPGGYRLAETELGDARRLLARACAPGTPFSRLAASRPGFPAMLGRALARFEAGLERNVVVEALNDHLLALRFVLEGGGPADLGLPMRVAALCAEPDRRDRGQGGRRPRARPRARALERRARPGRRLDDAGRDRRRARGSGAGDPQGRRGRPPRLRPARDRRRDPARRRPRGRRRRRRAARRDHRVGPGAGRRALRPVRAARRARGARGRGGGAGACRGARRNRPRRSPSSTGESHPNRAPSRRRSW